MRIYFRVGSPLLALILILIGITRGWVLFPLIALAILFMIIFCVCALGWFATDPIGITKEMAEDHKRIYSDYLVVDANTKQIIRRYSSFIDAKDDIILWGRTIKNGYDFDGKMIHRHVYFKHNGFKENGYGYVHYDVILYKEYDYNKEGGNN